MTLNHVTIAVRAIYKRIIQERKFQAACLGAEIKDNENSTFEATEDQELAIMKIAEKKLSEKGLKKWPT